MCDYFSFVFGIFQILGSLAIEDMDGGTFTISNGGVFGSLMGTPIINPPQSSILGMHGIFDRPVAVKGQVIKKVSFYVFRKFTCHFCLPFRW